MDTKSDYQESIIFNAALRVALSNLKDTPQKILNQPLSDCMLDDMSDLNFEDYSVMDFIDMLTHKKHSEMTVGSLRDLVVEALSVCSASHVASRWSSNSDERGLRAISQRCLREESLIHLNQLLVYIGGMGLNESYDIARKSFTEYPKESEYNNVSYSLGMDFTWDSVDEYSSNMSVIDYESKNLLKLLDESRYVIEEFLLRHSEISYAADANVHINNIVVHMNGVEILAFPFDKSVDDMYHTELSLSSKLLDAQSLTGVENFAEILVSGNLFRSRECYAFKQHLKGKVLEHELGM